MSLILINLFWYRLIDMSKEIFGYIPFSSYTDILIMRRIKIYFSLCLIS
jgi:hypothetical protein